MASKGANDPYPPTPMVVLSWTQLSEVHLEDGYLGTPLAALVAKSWAIFTSSVPSNGNVVSSNCTCALTNIFPLSGW